MTLRPRVDIAFLESRESELRRIQIEAMVRRAFRAIDSASGLTESDPDWLRVLVLTGPASAMDREDVCKAVESAIRNQESPALSKMSKLVSRPSLTKERINASITKVEWLLLHHWLACDGAPLEASLCYYNDTALAKRVELQLGLVPGSQYSGKYIRKVWERGLGLKKGTLLFRDVQAEDGRIFPVYYKQFLTTHPT
jgi:hypothetical protein